MYSTKQCKSDRAAVYRIYRAFGLVPLEDMRKKVLKLQTTAENMEEIKYADDMLENALALSVSSVYQTNCSPRVKKSLKKISESSKRGALTVFTAVLTNIM